MSEYFFGVSRQRISDELAEQVNKIAKENDAEMVVVHNLPGTGYQRWFSCPNRGEPFNRTAAAAVYKALEEAGIELP
jgi:hypothetical protein